MKYQTHKWLFAAVAVMPALALSQGAPPAGKMGGDAALDQHAFFGALDADHDGRVTLAEWKAGGMPENVFAMLDAKHTGAATFADFAAHPPMTSFDADKDGSVTLKEMTDAMAKQAASGGPPGGNPPPPAPGK